MRELWAHRYIDGFGSKQIRPARAILPHPSSYRSWPHWKMDQLRYELGSKVLKRPYGTQSDSGVTTSVTTADSYASVYTSTVPPKMKRISKLRLGLAVDPGVTAASVRQAPLFRLTGSGLAEQNPHNFLGMFGGYAEVTTGGVSQSVMVIEYPTNIPVQENGPVLAEVNPAREAQTAGTALANIFYDEKPPAEPNGMADTSEVAGTTTADAYATLTSITVPMGAGASKPTKLKGIAIAVAPDQGVAAVSLRLATRVRLTGGGLGEGGLHEFIGPIGTDAIVTSGNMFHDQLTRLIYPEIPIPVNAAGIISWEHRFDTEVPTASSFAIGLLYA